MKKYTTCELRNPNNNFIVRVVNNKELNKLKYYCPALDNSYNVGYFETSTGVRHKTPPRNKGKEFNIIPFYQIRFERDTTLTSDTKFCIGLCNDDAVEYTKKMTGRKDIYKESLFAHFPAFVNEQNGKLCTTSYEVQYGYLFLEESKFRKIILKQK